jgi:hypothetical protein
MEGSLNLVDEGNGACRDGKGCQEVCRLRGDDGFDQGGAAGRSNKIPVPSGKFPGAFVFEVLDVFPSYGPNRKR